MSSLVSKSQHCQRGYSVPVVIPPRTVIQVEDSAVEANLIISKDNRENDSYESSDVESEGTLGASSYLHLRKEMDEELQLAVKKLASSSNKSTAKKHDLSVKSSSGVSENSFYSTGSYSPELTMTLIRPDPKPPRAVPRRPPAATVIGAINMYSPFDDEDILSLCTNNHWIYNDGKTSNESVIATSPFKQSCLVGSCSDVRKDTNTTVDREDVLLEDSLYNGDCSNESFSSCVSSDSDSIGFIGHEIEVRSTDIIRPQFDFPCPHALPSLSMSLINHSNCITLNESDSLATDNPQLHESKRITCGSAEAKNICAAIEFCKSLARIESIPSKRARFDVVQRVEEQVSKGQGRASSQLSFGENSPKNDLYDIAGNIIWSFDSNVYCNTEISQEIYDSLRARERDFHAIGFNFMASQRAGDSTKTDRRVVILNILEERHSLNVTDETLHLAIYILDKCLDTFRIAKDSLSDVAAVSLILASKMEEYDPLRMSSVIKVPLTTTTDKVRLSNIEKRILFELHYSFNFPTPFTYANYFHTHLRSTHTQICLSNFLLELALLDSSYRNFGGSKVAHASVCLAYAVAKNERACSERDALIEAERELAVCSRLAVAATRTVMRELVEEMKRASEEMNVVWKEYCSEQMGCVSLFEIPPTLMQLILSNDRV